MRCKVLVSGQSGTKRPSLVKDQGFAIPRPVGRFKHVFRAVNNLAVATFDIQDFQPARERILAALETRLHRHHDAHIVEIGLLDNIVFM